MLDGVHIAGWHPQQVARAGVVYVREGRLIFPDLTAIENIEVAERRSAQSWPIPRLLELFPSLRERARNKGARSGPGDASSVQQRRDHSVGRVEHEPRRGVGERTEHGQGAHVV